MAKSNYKKGDIISVITLAQQGDIKALEELIRRVQKHVYALFSHLTYKKEDILSFNLPYVQNSDEGVYDPYNDIPRVQHPYSKLEIYAVDSSYMFMISDDEELINKFKAIYPLYIEDNLHIDYIE